MRTAFLFSMTNPVGLTQACYFTSFDSKYWRNFYFVAKWSGGTCTLDVYDSLETAQARADDGLTTGRLLFATGLVAGEQSVTLTLDGAAAWDPTPVIVRVVLVSTWGVAVVGFIDCPEAYLLDRMRDLLLLYAAPHESLAECGVTDGSQIVLSHVRPGMVAANKPVIGLALSTMDAEPYSNSPVAMIGPLVGIYSWVAAQPIGTAAILSARIMGALRSIFLDEQRHLAGMVRIIETPSASSYWRIAEEYPDAEAEGYFFRAYMPVVCKVDTMLPALYTALPGGGGTNHKGGKYPLEL